MEITITYGRDDPTHPSGPVKIGWALGDTGKVPSVMYYPPERVRSADASRIHAKSASRCPAVINLESRYFLVRCPFDLHMQFCRDKDGRPAVTLLDGSQAAVRKNAMSNLVAIVSETEWRYPNRPILQIPVPFLFFADEPVYLNQVAPFLHFTNPPWPGTIFGGRFPITNWPRPLMWAFEWHDISQPLKIRRGDPMFYAMFEADRPERSVQLVEAEITPEVRTYIDHVSGAVNYANQTFSLFDEAARVRPKTLIIPKKPSG